jgi:prevent-host-death family protein
MRRHFGEVIQRIRSRQEHTIIQSSGEPIAVLLPMAEYEQLLRYKRLMVFDEFTRDFGLAIEKHGLNEEQLMAELEEIKREIFQERYGQFG